MSLIHLISKSLFLQIPLMLYHGAQQERRKLVRKIHGRQGSLKIHPVVITSFEIAMRDRNALQVLIFLQKADDGWNVSLIMAVFFNIHLTEQQKKTLHAACLVSVMGAAMLAFSSAIICFIGDYGVFSA